MNKPTIEVDKFAVDQYGTKVLIIKLAGNIVYTNHGRYHITKLKFL